MLLKLAVRNILRQRTRTAMTLAAIVVSVIGLIVSSGFVEDIFLQLGEAVIHSQSGHLQIAKTGYFAEGTRKPEQYLISDPEPLRRRVAGLAGVDDAMARLHFSGLLNNRRADFAVVGEGIESDRESRLGTYLTLKGGRQLVAGDRYAMLIGEGVAEALQLKPEDEATLLVSTPEGATNALPFRVVGVFASFSKDYDAHTVKVPLAAAQELLDTNGANVLVVSLQRTKDTASVLAAVDAMLAEQGFETQRWEVLNDFYKKTVDLYDRQLGVLKIIVLFMVLLSVTNTVNMTIHERTGEIGTMRAMGNRGVFVFSLLMTESALLGLIGALAGLILGVVLAGVISAVGIPMPPPPNANLGYTAQIRLLPGSLAGAFLIGCLATMAACVLPALRVMKIGVVDALRHNT
jgi:putative ABC transport system permease protein